MNFIILSPGSQRLNFALLQATAKSPLHQESGLDYRGSAATRRTLKHILSVCGEKCAESTRRVWAVRVPFGGEIFNRPTMLDDQALQALESLVPMAPLHLPPILELLKEIQTMPDQAPCVLAFETAFFARMPRREADYALELGMMDSAATRRFGYQGLYHGAATAWVNRLRRERGEQGLARIFSICLDPRPEVAAVLGNRPVTVTSGLTPLEGLPGETSCGELDPGIIIVLSRQMGWGPERINTILSREGGLLGLTGRRVTWAEAINNESDPAMKLACELLLYRLLQACGAAAAAMGGVNHIIFSGRYAQSGRKIGPALLARLQAGSGARSSPVDWDCFAASRESIIAEQAAAMALLVRGSGYH